MMEAAAAPVPPPPAVPVLLRQNKMAQILETEDVAQRAPQINRQEPAPPAEPASAAVHLETETTGTIRPATVDDIPAMQALINGFAQQNRMLFRSRTELAE